MVPVECSSRSASRSGRRDGDNYSVAEGMKERRIKESGRVTRVQALIIELNLKVDDCDNAQTTKERERKRRISKILCPAPPICLVDDIVTSRSQDD